MSRFAPVRQRTAALILASAGAVLSIAPTAHAGPTTTRWAAPVSGGFYDPTNWSDGVGPALGADMVIDATGQAYTVDWSQILSTPLGPRVNSLLLDSDDARLLLRGNQWFADRDFRVTTDTIIRRGTFELTGQLFSAGALRIETGGTLDIKEGPSGSGFRGGQLALDVFNEGDFIVRGGASLSQIRAGESLSSGIRIVNQKSGTMRFEGGNLFTGGVLDNHGLVVFENDPQYNGGFPPFDVEGAVFGPLDFQPTTFNNHGTVRVERGRLAIGSDGLHSGQFELLDPDAVLVIGGDNWFLPGSRITGSGTTFLNRFGSVGGALSIEGDLELDALGAKINASLDVGGTLRLRSGADGEFGGAVRANLIGGSNGRNFRFLSAADIAFDDAIGSAEFFAPAIVRSDLTSLQERSVFHQDAEITGSVGNAAFMREAFIGGNASNVELNRGASIGGNLTGGATAIGRVNVQGDLIATSGAWSFTGDGSIDALLDVGGDITITRPFEFRGDIIAKGDLSANQGRFANITADTVRFGVSSSSTHGNISVFGNARIETGGARAIIDRALISSDFNQAPIGSENVTFVNGFEVIYNPVTQFTRSGFSVVVNADTMRETTFRFLADSILAGTLDVAVIGDASNLSLGDSFTILDARPFDTGDPVATITGEFDRLFLPSLANGLFFDVLYEPSAVRLVVVPAPGAVSLLALAGLAATRRRRSRATAVSASTILASLACFTASAHAGPTTTRWAAPISGNFFDAANWENGVAPSSTIGAIIDAVGATYTVMRHVGPPTPPSVRSILLDSPDAHLSMLSGFGSFFVDEGIEARQGTFSFQGTLRGDVVRIRESARFEVLRIVPSSIGAYLVLDVINEGSMNIAGRAGVIQHNSSIQQDRAITNTATGVMRFAGGNALTLSTLINHGVIEVENAEEYEEQIPGTSFAGTAFGFVEGVYRDPSHFDNHGVVRVHRGVLRVDGEGTHSGEYQLLNPDSELEFRGVQVFLDNMRISGPGTTRLHEPNDMSGTVRTEGSLFLNLTTDPNGHSLVDLTLEADQTLTIDADGRHFEFLAPVRAGVIDAPGSSERLIFRNDADVALGASFRLTEFHGDTTIRGDLVVSTTGASTHHGQTLIEGDWSGGSGRGSGHIVVRGDLHASAGEWSFERSGSTAPQIIVEGDIDIFTPFTMQGEIIGAGAFHAAAGQFESVTANAIQFGRSDPANPTITVLQSGSVITSRNAPAVIANTRLRPASNGSAMGAEEIVFANGFEMISMNSGLTVILNSETGNATTYFTHADSSLGGTLAVAVFGDPDLLSVGDSFTIIVGSPGLDGLGHPPEIAGAFQRIVSPPFSDSLFFDVVYEPSAVRLVVVPTPGALSLFALAGLANARRARRTPITR